MDLTIQIRKEWGIRAINLAQKYANKVDERFKLSSLTEPLVNNDYDWDGVDTIKVYRIPTVPLNDYNRTGTNRYGTPQELQDELDTYQLKTDKAFTFTIDKGNKQDQLNVKDAGKALRRQIDEVIVPAKDMQRLAVIAQAAVDNNMIGTGAISKTNAYEKFLDGMEALDNKKVPLAGRVAVITPAFFKFIKLDSSFVKASDMGMKISINGLVGEIDGVKLIKVPASYLPTGCQFIITHKIATVSPSKLTDYKIHRDPPGINGNLVEGRVRYDTFVLEAKKDAIYAHFTSSPSATSYTATSDITYAANKTYYVKEGNFYRALILGNDYNVGDTISGTLYEKN